MSESILEGQTALRAKAWAQVKETTAYAAYKAMDDAVVALGGDSVILSGSIKAREVFAESVVIRPDVAPPPRRPSQVHAAASALREIGMPMQIGTLMLAAIAKGAEVGGGNPIANFRSALSKDERFEAVKRDGVFFWWFAGEPLPLKFQAEHKETADPDLLAESAVSDPSSQEGGDANAATNVT